MNLTKPSGNYSVSETDEIIYYSQGNYTVVLPFARGTQRQLKVVNVGSGIITITPQPLDTIQGSANWTAYGGHTIDLIDLDSQRWIIT